MGISQKELNFFIVESKDSAVINKILINVVKDSESGYHLTVTNSYSYNVDYNSHILESHYQYIKKRLVTIR